MKNRTDAVVDVETYVYMYMYIYIYSSCRLKSEINNILSYGFPKSEELL
jgi:hypothetical protein